MRHRVYGKHLGRDKDQRTNLFKGLIQSLFIHGTIKTSEAKAKAIKGLVDKVVNFAKDKNTQKVQSFLNNKDYVDRLIKELAPKFSSRNSGYTSLIKMGTRAGDQTMVVKMSLIGAEELKPLEKTSPKVKKIEKKAEEPKKIVSVKKAAAKKPTKRTTSKRK